MTDYSYETGATSKNYRAGRQGQKITGITIHHWGGPGQAFNNVVHWLCTNDRPSSAHYIVQGTNADGTISRRVACIVDPDDTAYHAGNWAANLATIGIECRPEARDEDYAVVAELIRRLRSVYGDLPLYPHRHWTNTACPGKWDLDRLDLLARATTTPTPDPDIGDHIMSMTAKERAQFIADVARAVWRTDGLIEAPDPKAENTHWMGASYARNIYLDGQRVRAELGALRAAVAALAKGTALTEAQVQRACAAGAAEALAEGVDVNVTVGGAQ